MILEMKFKGEGIKRIHLNLDFPDDATEQEKVLMYLEAKEQMIKTYLQFNIILKTD